MAHTRVSFEPIDDPFIDDIIDNGRRFTLVNGDEFLSVSPSAKLKWLVKRMEKDVSPDVRRKGLEPA